VGEATEPVATLAGDDEVSVVESVDASWFVRPPSGGQFGPTTPDGMRQWIVEGRVTGDSLVWHEGWDEWIPAADVFDEFAAASKTKNRKEKKNKTRKSKAAVGVPPIRKPIGAEPPELPTKTPAIDVTAPIVTEPGRRTIHARRRRARRPTRLVAWLTIAVIVLGVVFVWVTFYR